MSNALVTSPDAVLPLAPTDPTYPLVPWRDPHTVSPVELAAYIRQLERACVENPRSADLRTCLGMAHAVNYDVYKSMDVLESAIAIEPGHFWSQFKYAELQYRLRALVRAEEETRKAIDLANNAWQLSLARSQMRQIRKLLHESTRNVTWTKPLTAPAFVVAGLFAALFVVMLWK